MNLGVPWWLSGLRIWCCHWCGVGVHSLDWEHLHATDMGKKKKKKVKINDKAWKYWEGPL